MPCTRSSARTRRGKASKRSRSKETTTNDQLEIITQVVEALDNEAPSPTQAQPPSESDSGDAPVAQFERAARGTGTFKCDQCPAVTQRLCDLKRHKAGHDKSTHTMCTDCSYTCAQPYNLKTHMREHHNKGPALICVMRHPESPEGSKGRICGFVTRSPPKMSGHRTKIHKGVTGERNAELYEGTPSIIMHWKPIVFDLPEGMIFRLLRKEPKKPASSKSRDDPELESSTSPEPSTLPPSPSVSMSSASSDELPITPPGEESVDRIMKDDRPDLHTATTLAQPSPDADRAISYSDAVQVPGLSPLRSHENPFSLDRLRHVAACLKIPESQSNVPRHLAHRSTPYEYRSPSQGYDTSNRINPFHDTQYIPESISTSNQEGSISFSLRPVQRW